MNRKLTKKLKQLIEIWLLFFFNVALCESQQQVNEVDGHTCEGEEPRQEDKLSSLVVFRKDAHGNGAKTSVTADNWVSGKNKCKAA